MLYSTYILYFTIVTILQQFIIESTTSSYSDVTEINTICQTKMSKTTLDVATDIGVFRGLVCDCTNGGSACVVFRGIPFAEPPVGKKRFQVCIINFFLRFPSFSYLFSNIRHIFKY